MPDEKEIKKVIAESYNFILPKLIEKIKVKAKSVSLTTNMQTARNGQEYIGIICSYINSNFILNEITLTANHIRYSHIA